MRRSRPSMNTLSLARLAAVASFLDCRLAAILAWNSSFSSAGGGGGGG